MATSGSSSRDLLMVSLSRFYSAKTNMLRVLPFVSPTTSNGVSLRLIDWFVTNYAKTNNVILTRTMQNNVVHFNVYLSYRTQLKAYSKQLFDPFRRRDRIEFYYERNKSIQTTIGQLNFFRWMIQNDILEYISENSQAIEASMLASQKEQKAAEETKPVEDAKPKKQTRVSNKLQANMSRLTGARTVCFD